MQSRALRVSFDAECHARAQRGAHLTVSLRSGVVAGVAAVTMSQPADGLWTVKMIACTLQFQVLFLFLGDEVLLVLGWLLVLMLARILVLLPCCGLGFRRVPGSALPDFCKHPRSLPGPRRDGNGGRFVRSPCTLQTQHNRCCPLFPVQ